MNTNVIITGAAGTDRAINTADVEDALDFFDAHVESGSRVALSIHASNVADVENILTALTAISSAVDVRDVE